MPQFSLIYFRNEKVPKSSVSICCRTEATSQHLPYVQGSDGTRTETRHRSQDEEREGLQEKETSVPPHCGDRARALFSSIPSTQQVQSISNEIYFILWFLDAWYNCFQTTTTRSTIAINANVPSWEEMLWGTPPSTSVRMSPRLRVIYRRAG